MASTVKGLTRTQAALRRLTPAMVESITEAVDKGAKAVESRAKAIAPRDSGDMAGAIEVRENLDGFRATGAIGNFAATMRDAGASKRDKGIAARALRENQAEQGISRFVGVFPTKAGDPGWYAAWVEYGTTKNAAKPFLLPSFISQRKSIESRIKRAVNKAIRTIARGGA